MPTLNGKAPFEIILALERLGNIIRGINVERDLAKYYWVAYDKNAYEGCRRVMREIEGKPKNFKLHEEILIKIHPAEVFGAWVLEEPRRWSSEKTALKGLESLRNEAAKEPSRRDRLYAVCRESKAAAVYLERRALDIAHYGRDVADLTFPEPSLAGATRSQVSEVVDWMVSVIQRAQKRQENEKERAQFKDQEQYLRKRQKEADGGIPYDKVLLPAVISERVLARGELEAAKDACFRELTAGDESEWDAKGVLRVITDLVHFCECLARPENQFMVPSGRYVEKEVNTRTEADMVNEAVRELVGLPKYTAYAKVQHWTGKIQTLEVPQACWNLEVAFPDRRYYKKRNEIEVEIIARQEGWKPAETDEPPPVHS